MFMNILYSIYLGTYCQTWFNSSLSSFCIWRVNIRSEEQMEFSKYHIYVLVNTG